MDPDLPLIHALQNGDDSALNELMNRHREALFHFAFRVVRDETLARDVVQEAFVRAYFGAAKFKPRASVKTWLYSIALNLGRDHVRRRSKRRGDLSIDDDSRPFGRRAEIADQAPSANQSARDRDDYALLSRAIDELPVKLREALVVFVLEQKSQREAADILGTTPKTVELRVYRAKQKLREWLKTFGAPGDWLRDKAPSERLKS